MAKSLVTLLYQNGCLSIENKDILFGDLFSALLNEAFTCQFAHRKRGYYAHEPPLRQ